MCDVIEPWEHGVVLRATRFPDYYDFNVVRVDETPGGMSAEELAAFADEALAGHAHRRVDLEFEPAAAERLRAGFERLGWLSERLVWMRHEAPRAARPADRGGAGALRRRASPARGLAPRGLPGDRPGPFLDQAREVAMKLGVQVFAAFEGGRPVAYAQLERLGDRVRAQPAVRAP